MQNIINQLKLTSMNTSELKKLADQFSEFIGEDFENIEGKVREFWFATFGCNNAEREAELLDYWKAN